MDFKIKREGNIMCFNKVLKVGYMTNRLAVQFNELKIYWIYELLRLIFSGAGGY